MSRINALMVGAIALAGVLCVGSAEAMQVRLTNGTSFPNVFDVFDVNANRLTYVGLPLGPYGSVILNIAESSAGKGDLQITKRGGQRVSFSLLEPGQEINW